VLAVLLWLIAEPLTGLFSEASSIQDVAVHYLWIASISYGAYGLVMSVNAAFNGMGKPIPGVIISSCRVIFVFLPLALAGRQLIGLEGLFLATAVSNVLMGTIAFAWLGRQVAREAALAAGHGTVQSR
jgi:Na+-driven multidrug efflux pump